jgi:hypothetical protein
MGATAGAGIFAGGDGLGGGVRHGLFFANGVGVFPAYSVQEKISQSRAWFFGLENHVP